MNPAPQAPNLGPHKLNSPLCGIYKNILTTRLIGPLQAGEGAAFVTEHLKPIDSVEASYDQLMRTGVPIAGLAPVQFTTLRLLITVIAQAAAGNGSTTQDLFRDMTVLGQQIPGVMTVRQFMQLNAAGQLAVIDLAWERVCSKKAYDKVSSAMYEPTATTVAAKTTPVPSGMVPDGAGGYRVGYAGPGGRPNAFTGLGVGFRVDGSGENCDRDIERVSRDGMTTQLKNRYLMHNIKGWEVQGTVVDRDTSAPRVWETKKDLFNESAVCIARNLYGATAFPTRELVGEAVLWAADVSGLVGFDTETYQTTLTGNKQWRPGEKAYMFVAPSRVIGYVKFQKRGTTEAGGWKFMIPATAEWTFLPAWQPPRGGWSEETRRGKVREYVTAQLHAWRGPEHFIPGTFDFA